MIPQVQGLNCPVPYREDERILLGHGSGGQLSAALFRDVIAPALGAGAPAPIVDDAAVVTLPDATGPSLVFSTDAFVVNPREFPGGGIGDLAVNGTINDLAMMGGQPLALSLAFIVEEGLPIAELERAAVAVGQAAAEAGVPVVTGDTKVVGRGAADGLYIVTSGVGVTGPSRPAAGRARPGDAILLSGPIAAHGMAVMGAREDFGFDSHEIRSDTRALHRLVEDLLAVAPDTHVLRDPTRGGLASALNEIAATARVGVELDESAIPVSDPVQAACDLLGLDPMHVANEGVCVAFVPAGQAEAALAVMRATGTATAALIGEAVAAHPGRVQMRTLVGSHRIVDPLVGEQLPRIC